MKTKILAFTILGFFLFPMAYAQSSTPSIDKKTFVYKTVGTLPIEADLYQTTDGTGLKPVIIWIHGGALMGGSRAGISEEQKKLYLGAGYSIVSIDYRLAPETKLPAIIEDVQDAVKWTRKNAASLLKVDSTKMFIIGHSAGGYLTLMLGSSLKKPVQGIVSFYGYGDIIADWYSKPDPYYLRTRDHVTEERAMKQINNTEITSSPSKERGDVYMYSRQNGKWPLMVGGHDPVKEAQWFYPYCPLRNVHANYPPTLLIHGDKDTDVPFEQSVLMDQELTAKKIKHQFIKMNNYEHGLIAPMKTRTCKKYLPTCWPFSTVANRRDAMKVTRRQFVKTSILSSVSVGLTPGITKKLPIMNEKTTSDILNMSVHQLAQLIQKKKISSYEVVSTFVKRIEVVNPRLNAVVLFRPEEALKEAKKADEEFNRGKSKGVLHGIPCTIKDSFDTEGIVTTGGTLGRSNFIPKKNATIVQRLKDAGVIIMGKTNTPEFTMGFLTDNLVFGKTKNPFDLNRTPGGSSGGAAAIVAAGGSPFDIGTDTGGSIRYPAHCCGIIGIKPTTGRVPRTGHIIAYQGVSQSLTQVGPLTKNVEDINLLLNIISGVDNIDPYIYPVPLQDYSKVDLKKLRLAFFVDNGLVRPSDDTFSTIKKNVDILATAGLTVNEEIPKGIEETATFRPYLRTGDWMKRMLDQYGTTKTLLDYNLPDPPTSEYAALVEKVDNYRSSMLSFWSKYDVLICPVSPVPAPVLDVKWEVPPYFSYLTAFNTTGWPSIVIRGGTSAEGLPIGIQIVAPPWREDICLAVAKFLESELGPWKNDMMVDRG